LRVKHYPLEKRALVRKLFYIFLAFCITLGVYFYPKNNTPLEQRKCAFCCEQVLKNQKVYEDDLVIVLYTHKPITPCHFLIIPKRHAERFEALSGEESSHIFQVIKEVDKAAQKVFATSSYLLLQKNGLEVGQTVPHVHFHYVARPSGSSSSISIMAKMLLEPLRKPISSEKMQDITSKMTETMAQKAI
jgi:histidine triad (HIT) family protein